jgi:beta-lactamase regulating signal transducer with metallopeptidase domain
MSTFFADPVIDAAASLLIKATLLLALAAIAQVAMRRRASAAARHAIWTLAIAALLLLPVMSQVLPPWPVIITAAPIQAGLKPGPTSQITAAPMEPWLTQSPTTGIPAPPAPAIVAASPTDTDSASQWPVVTVVAAVYLAGLAMMSLLLGLQWRSARRIAVTTDAAMAPEWTQLLAACAATMGVHRAVQVRRSRARTMPMVLGIRQPIVIVPAIADEWSDDRRHAVMLHELAHVARYDCLTQTLASAACALYWFHPGVWWAARQLRIERELACDDRVIAAGAPAREYAGHLLEIAYSLGSRRAPALAVTIARPQQLEDRLLAALDAARNRRAPGVRVRVAVAAIAAALLLTVASATSKVENVTTPPDQSLQAEAAPAPSQQAGQDPASRLVEARLDRLVRYTLTTFGLQDLLPGTWEIRPTDTENLVNLRMTEGRSSWGSTVPLQQFEGLTTAALSGGGEVVRFQLRRDAGTFTFEGVFRNGAGAGTFTFDANPAFRTELTKRGFAAPTALEQYRLARNDVGYAFIDELTKQGYAKPDTAGLVRAGDHGVNTTYVREMGAEGYRLGTLEPLITLRDHGVTPAYIRGLAELGYKAVPADDLRKARDHGVTPDYVRGLRDSGYSGLPLAQLISARDHGVDPAFVQGLAEAGHRNLAIEHAIKVRDHGVTPDYVRGMRDHGYGSLSIDELINARDHGVDLDYVSSMRTLGYTGLPMTGLVRLRDHGVTPRYVEELKALGYDGLAAEDLILLLDHGATAERIRAANTRAGTRLPIDMLRSLARRGGLQ